MNISILTTDPNHPVNAALKGWQDNMTQLGHHVEIFHKKSELTGGDILFLISCSELIREEDKKKFKTSLVVHGSDLPKGRGWSPHIWSIIAGEKKINVCLLEAAPQVDTGDVWLRDEFYLEGHELLAEINEKWFATELRLMTRAINEFNSIVPVAQTGDPGEYCKKRTSEDSRLDPNKTLAEQFNLLRTVDNARYPAFFEYCGERYLLKIEKTKKNV